VEGLYGKPNDIRRNPKHITVMSLSKSKMKVLCSKYLVGRLKTREVQRVSLILKESISRGKEGR